MPRALDDNERRVLRLKTRKATLEALRALGGEAQRREILAWASSHGGFTERERMAPAPAKAEHKYSNAVDHQLGWVLTDLKRQGLVTNPKWSTWCLVSATKPKARADALNAPSPERLLELRNMPYRLYLRTPEWRRVRDAALQENGYACSLDVSHKEGLEVHHRSYENRGTERPNDLIVLCRACHRLHHAEYGLPRAAHPSQSSPGLMGEGRLAPMSPSDHGNAPRRQSSLRQALGKFVRAQITD